MLFSHLGENTSGATLDIPENAYVICVSETLLSHFVQPQCLWFQRLLSPLDDSLSSLASGIALFPDEDGFLIQMEHLFSVVWLAQHDHYPIFLQLTRNDVKTVSSWVNEVEDVPIILSLGEAWSPEELSALHQRIRNPYVFFDVTCNKRLQQTVLKNASIPVLNPPFSLLRSGEQASERFLRYMRRRADVSR